MKIKIRKRTKSNSRIKIMTEPPLADALLE